MSAKDCNIDNNNNKSKYISDKNDLLRGVINKSAELQTCTIDFESNELKDVKHYFDSPVESWPMIVSKQYVQDVEHMGSNIIQILKKVLLNYQDKLIAYAALIRDQKLIDKCFSHLKDDETLSGLLLRFDLVISDDQLKIIEINSGSSLGGWHLDFLEVIVNGNIQRDNELKDLNIEYFRILDNAFISLLAAASEKIENASGNIMIFSDKDDEISFTVIQKIFDRVKGDYFPDAKLIPYGSEDKLDVLSDNTIELNGDRIDVVLLNAVSDKDFSDELYDIFLNSYLSNKLIFPDNVGYAYIGAKHLMALLFEEETFETLNNKEIELIEKYFPWTCKTKNKEVTWRGKIYNVKDLLIENQNKFVIKKAFSSEGLDVLIGKSLSNKEWEELVYEKLTDDKWIAQEYFDPDPVALFSYPFPVIEKKFVWGAFNFNTHYQGTHGRSVFVDQDKVINAARGAIQSIIFNDSCGNK